jgi:outer membrane lipoprotein carrier protein
MARRVDAHYNRLHSLRVEFTETYQGMGMKRTERGTLLLEKSGRMKWLYADPAGKVFVLDGKYGYSYTPGDAQAERYPVKQLDDFRSPLRFLLGHTKIEKEFSGLTMAPDGADFQLRGVPKAMGPQVSSVALTVTANGTITALAWQDADGATTTFYLTDEQPNAAIPSDAFTFHPPEGVGVVQGLPPI